MEWIESRIVTNSQGIDAVCAMLYDCGITGLQIEDEVEMQLFLQQNPFKWDYVDEELMQVTTDGKAAVVFYTSVNAHGHETLLAVRQGIERLESLRAGLEIDLGALSLETKQVDDEEWLNIWKKYFHPFRVGERIVIKPTWETYEQQEGDLVFTIDPGHVFGTGLHQTTRLCIERLEKYVTPKSHVLDLGCGSGILSVIALMLGAESAFAVDLDPNAIAIANKNACLNGFDEEKYNVTSGNVLKDEVLRNQIKQKKYDVILANIVADVVIEVTPLVKDCLADGGIFIASGIIRERLADVNAALSESFQITDTFYQDDWVCVVAER